LGAFFLNRKEAVDLISAIHSKCMPLDMVHIMLMPPDADDVLSRGYQLHIKATLSDGNLECIKPLLEKNKLAFANEPEKQLLVIYRPLKKKNQSLQT
jgi:hypothetical protein